MGVIGIVSALTLPNLNSSTSDKEKLAKFKKIHQNVDDAIGRAIAVYGPYEDWFVGLGDFTAKQKRASERITEFMKVQKICEPNATGCFTDDDGYINHISGNDQTGPFDKSMYRYILADGTSFVIDGNPNPSIWFDIDGPSKGKYTIGMDVFELKYKTDATTIDMPDDSTLSISAKTCIEGDPDSCMMWILITDNMEYLKANSAGECKNNTSITLNGTTNTTCK